MSTNIKRTTLELKESKWRELAAANPNACRATFNAAWDIVWAACESHAREAQEPYGHVLIDNPEVLELGTQEHHGDGNWEPVYLRPIPVGEGEDFAGLARVPVSPPQGLLNSMGMRYRHDFFMLPEEQKDSIRRSMRQLHEEVVGTGFWNYDNPSPLHLSGKF